MYNQQAQNLAQQGRYGDNMLVHMNPQEVAGLAALARAKGGHITINPHTGLPEAWSIGSITGSSGILGKAASAVGLGNLYSSASKGVSGALQGITKALAPVAPLLGLIPGVGVPLAAIVGGMADGKSWNFKRGLMSGVGAYGLNSLMYPGVSATAAPITSAETLSPEVAASRAADVAKTDAFGNLGYEGVPAGTQSYTLPPNTPIPSGNPPPSAIPTPTAATTPTGDVFSQAWNTVKDLAPSKDTMQTVKDVGQIGTTALTAYGGVKSYAETKAAKDQANAILAQQQAHTQQEIDWAKQVMAQSPSRFDRLTAADVQRYGIGTPTYMAAGGVADSFDDEPGSDDTGIAQGGLMGLAAGGMPPQYLRGGGDGMSDSIPANIGGKQEARLADGEFIVPADVVSHIGNGSSNAGAKKLYAMMDRVRQARTGKTKQAPAVNVNRMMPA